MAETSTIASDLEEIKRDLKYIKEHMVDADSILTPEEKASLKAARAEYKAGKTTSLENVKKELGL